MSLVLTTTKQLATVEQAPRRLLSLAPVPLPQQRARGVELHVKGTALSRIPVRGLWPPGTHTSRAAMAQAADGGAGRAAGGPEGSLVAIIADEDTITGFLLAGVGNVDLRRKSNFLIVDQKTPARAIEDAFKDFTTRDDIAVVLINQYIADMVRHLVDSYTKPVPAVLEIPSKDRPYDPAKDSILVRVKHLLGGPGGEGM